MPMQAFVVSLAAAATTEIVDNSKRITGVSITELTAGANFKFKLGNNPPSSRIHDVGNVELKGKIDPRDTNEGFAIVNDTAQAGAQLEGFISYEVAGYDGAITYEGV